MVISGRTIYKRPPLSPPPLVLPERDPISCVVNAEYDGILVGVFRYLPDQNHGNLRTAFLYRG